MPKRKRRETTSGSPTYSGNKQRCTNSNQDIQLAQSEISGCSKIDISDIRSSHKDSEHPEVRSKRLRSNIKSDSIVTQSEISGCSTTDISDIRSSYKDSEHPEVRSKRLRSNIKSDNIVTQSEISGCSTTDISDIRSSYKDSEHPEVRSKRLRSNIKSDNIVTQSEISGCSSSDISDITSSYKDSEHPEVRSKCLRGNKKCDNIVTQSEISGCSTTDISDIRSSYKDSEHPEVRSKRLRSNIKSDNIVTQSEISGCSKTDISDIRSSYKDSEHPEVTSKRLRSNIKSDNIVTQSEISGCSSSDISDITSSYKDSEHPEVRSKCLRGNKKCDNIVTQSEISGCSSSHFSDIRSSHKDSEHPEVRSKCLRSNIKSDNIVTQSEISGCSKTDISDIRSSHKDSEHPEVRSKRLRYNIKSDNIVTQSEISGCSSSDIPDIRSSHKDSEHPEVRSKGLRSNQKCDNIVTQSEISGCTSSHSSDIRSSHKDSEHPEMRSKHLRSNINSDNIVTQSEISGCSSSHISESRSSHKDSEHPDVRSKHLRSNIKSDNIVTQSEISGCSSSDIPDIRSSHKDSEHLEVRSKRLRSNQKYDNILTQSEISGSSSSDISDIKSSHKDSENPEVRAKKRTAYRKCDNSVNQSEVSACSSCENLDLTFLHMNSENPTVNRKCTKDQLDNFVMLSETPRIVKPKRKNKTRSRGSTRLGRKADRERKKKQRAQIKNVLQDKELKVDRLDDSMNITDRNMDSVNLDSVNNTIYRGFANDSYKQQNREHQRQRYDQDLLYRESKKLARRRHYEEDKKLVTSNKYRNVDIVNVDNVKKTFSRHFLKDSYKQQNREHQRQRYDQDLLYRESKKLAGRCRYKEDLFYRRNKKLYTSHRYNQNVQYRHLLKTVGIQRYRDNRYYRRHLKIANLNRYRCNSQHRKKVKERSVHEYRFNILNKKKIKDASIHKYRDNREHRDKVKDASIHKYRDDSEHRDKVKDASIHKYRDDSEHRDKVKDASIHKYRDDSEHRDKVKEASIHKYRCDPEHRQYLKSYTKSQYKQHASYRQKKKDRLRNQYKSDKNVRSEKIQKVKNQRKQKIKNISNIVQYFRQEVRNGPKQVCCVCHKFKFKKQVLVCDVEKYNRKGRKQQHMANRCISKKYVSDCTDQCHENCEILNHNKLWICYTCHQHLLKGEMPVDAAANNLDLQPIPDSLKNLNSFETQLLTLRLPFMKLVRLPKGGQNGVIGPCVSVPTDIQKTTSFLPRCEKDDQLVRVKLKRKLRYKGYHKYEYISTNKLHKGLRYLQDNNQWYSSVSLDTSWENPIEEIMPSNSDNDSDEGPVIQSSLEDPLQSDKNETNTDTEDEDQNQQDRGMPMDTCLQPADIGQEILDQYFDDIFCVAPGEGSTPVSMLRERGNEAMTFPVQYPDGTGTYDDDRPVRLTRTRYFHSRLLHADNRFAGDSNYLFYAQYLSELEQVISKVSIALRKASAKDHSGNSPSVEMLSDPSKLKKLFKTDQGYKFLTPIRGTPPYWQATLKDLFAMIRQLGIPTWFCTFSAADMIWTEVLEVLLEQQGSAQSPDDLDWMEKCEVLRNNSIMNAIMFNHRFHTFLREVIIRRQVIGKVKDHFHRIEFQLRGSPHSHCLFWIDGAPLLDEDDDETVCSFIDEYVSCKLPNEHDDIELHDVVSSVQQHSKGHSKSCRKKGTTCRFHFPRPPSERTFISRPKSLTDPSIELPPEQMTHKAKSTLQTLWDVITNSDLQEITTQNIFNAAGITQEDFEEASNILTKRTSVVLERSPADIWINQYNPTLIRCWNANMDIQYVSDAYSCVMYIISYISKAEREMGMILEDARKEAAEGNLEASQTMKQIGGAYFRHREVSAQEAAYRVCGMHLKETSRKVQFIPVGANPVRMSLPLHRIQQKSNTMDDKDIWMPTLSERYKARPFSEIFDNMCLATFCSQYRVLAASQVPKDISQTPHVYQLQNNLGFIQKRTRTQAAVVRYPRFSVKKNAELYYLSILQLFLPHRKDTQLKPDTFTNYEEFYSTGAVKLTSFSPPKTVRDIVEANRQHFEKNADALEDAQELAERVGPLEDAWAMIGPEAESDRLECQMEKSTDTSNDDDDLSIPDLELQHKKRKQDDIIHIRTNIPSTQEIMPLIQSLNSIQKQIFYTVRQWCLDKVNGKNPKPFHLFITGGAGTGKSHLIRCLSYQAHKILAPNSSNPDDTTVLLTAPTGVAAFNIGGTTLHQAFALPQHMSLPYQHLRDDKLNTLRSKFENLKILIIDEISMVGQQLLMYVTERLRQIKQSKNAIFGNLCVITVGDFYQLPAVRQKCLYDIRPKHYCSLWFDNFSVVHLQEIMRQREDLKFAELLNRLRVKTKQHTLTTDDFASLEACQHNTPDPETLHIFPTNAEVDAHNEKMINKVCDAYRCVFAEDFDKNPQNGRLTPRETPYETSAEYLPSSIYLGRGARVMLIRNVDVSDGLVNGVMGTVGGILPPPLGSSLSSAVEVTFDNDKVGINDRHKRQSSVVHIKPMEETLKNNAIRHQFPLRLAWGCTVHKVQGITADKAVVSLDKIFNAGMAYVALSRVTSIQGLTIQNFNPDKIYCSEQISIALQKMPNFFSQPENPVQISDTLNIILHNVQGLNPHIQDMRANSDLADSHFICLTETWMEQNTVKPAFNNYELHHNPRSRSYSSNTPLFDKLKQQKHGGVGVFTANSQHFCQVHLQQCDIEVIAFQIRHLDITVVVIYKPDSYTLSVFLQNLDNLLQQLPQDTAATLIMGDFNQDIMRQSSSVQNFMHNNGYKQLVKSSTTDGDTLIDHVYMKGNFEIFVDVIPTYYSYHNMVSVKLRQQ